MKGWFTMTHYEDLLKEMEALDRELLGKLNKAKFDKPELIEPARGEFLGKLEIVNGIVNEKMDLQELEDSGEVLDKLENLKSNQLYNTDDTYRKLVDKLALISTKISHELKRLDQEKSMAEAVAKMELIADESIDKSLEHIHLELSRPHPDIGILKSAITNTENINTKVNITIKKPGDKDELESETGYETALHRAIKKNMPEIVNLILEKVETEIMDEEYNEKDFSILLKAVIDNKTMSYVRKVVELLENKGYTAEEFLTKALMSKTTSWQEDADINFLYDLLKEYNYLVDSDFLANYAKSNPTEIYLLIKKAIALGDNDIADKMRSLTLEHAPAKEEYAIDVAEFHADLAVIGTDPPVDLSEIELLSTPAFKQLIELAKTLDSPQCTEYQKNTFTDIIIDSLNDFSNTLKPEIYEAIKGLIFEDVSPETGLEIALRTEDVDFMLDMIEKIEDIETLKSILDPKYIQTSTLFLELAKEKNHNGAIDKLTKISEIENVHLEETIPEKSTAPMAEEVKVGPESVRRLTDLGADISVKNKDHGTALELARENPNNIMEMLYADTRKPLETEPPQQFTIGSESETSQENPEPLPLEEGLEYSPVQSTDKKLFESIKKNTLSIDALKELVKEGANINAVNDEGNSVLREIMNNGKNYDLVIYLLDNGVDLEHTDSNKQTDRWVLLERYGVEDIESGVIRALILLEGKNLTDAATKALESATGRGQEIYNTTTQTISDAFGSARKIFNDFLAKIHPLNYCDAKQQLPKRNDEEFSRESSRSFLSSSTPRSKSADSLSKESHGKNLYTKKP